MPDNDTDVCQRKETSGDSDNSRSKSARGPLKPILWKMAPKLALLLREGRSTALLAACKNDLQNCLELWLMPFPKSPKTDLEIS